MRTTILACVSVMAGVAGVASAQASPYTIHIVVDPPVIEPGQEAMIELRAAFDGDRDFAMSLVLTSFLCSRGSDPLDDWHLLVALGGPGTQPGTRTTAGIEGILAGQVSFPGTAPADPTNPMPFWRVPYAAETDAEVGVVDLSTRTSRYAVYFSPSFPLTESRMLEMVDGSATLRIVACRADFDEDGALDLFDFLAFQNAFDAGEALADFDFDGELTVFDFLAFQNRFDQGCP